MAYFTFTAGVQVQEVRQLKQTLITAKNVALNIQRQNAEMTLAQMQAQFGVDAALTEAQWESTINAIVTLLDNQAVLDLIGKVGFST